MKIILAGSMISFEKMKLIKQRLEANGVVVAMPTGAGDSSPQVVRGFNHDALERLKSGDRLLVVNEEKQGVKGYVGSNTLIEIGMAFALGKPVYLLNDYDKTQDCTDELDALVDGIVGGDILKWLKEAV